MQCLSRYDRATGAKLPQNAFSSPKIGRFIQEGLVETGLAACLDPDSWKPTGHDFHRATPRAYLPFWELMLADTGSRVVSTFSDYKDGRSERRAPLHTESSLVRVDCASRVSIDESLIIALQRGTGVRCDFPALRPLLLNVPEHDRSRLIGATFAAVGREDVPELKPIWEQNSWGRLYSSKPALINMPTLVLPALRSCNDRPLWIVDFSNFELRIACMICDQELTDQDAYQSLGNSCGISRARVKHVINPMLHGQREQQLWYARERDDQAIADRPLVEKEMARSLPKLVAGGLDRLQQNSSLLQRTGARVFFSCMAAAIQLCGTSTGGVPKHDGWIFAGDKQQATDVHNAFEQQAKRITGVHLPVKTAPLV